MLPSLSAAIMGEFAVCATGYGCAGLSTDIVYRALVTKAVLVTHERDSDRQSWLKEVSLSEDSEGVGD